MKHDGLSGGQRNNGLACWLNGQEYIVTISGEAQSSRTSASTDLGVIVMYGACRKHDGASPPRQWASLKVDALSIVAFDNVCSYFFTDSWNGV